MNNIENIKNVAGEAFSPDVDGHPWKRFFARCIDDAILAVIALIPRMLILFYINYKIVSDPSFGPIRALADMGGYSGDEISAFDIIPLAHVMDIIDIFFIGLLAILLSFIYHPFMISKFGRTFGKMALGIKVTANDGSLLSFTKAFEREALQISYTMAYVSSFPLLCLFACFPAFIYQKGRLKKIGKTSWDDSIGSLVTFTK